MSTPPSTQILYRVEHPVSLSGPYSGFYPGDDDAAWECNEWLRYNCNHSPRTPALDRDFRSAGREDAYRAMCERSEGQPYAERWHCAFASLEHVASWFHARAVRRLDLGGFVLRELVLDPQAVEGLDWAAARSQAMVMPSAIIERRDLAWDMVEQTRQVAA